MAIFEELTCKATQATVAAIQTYNNPTAVYRAETFAILSINGWELLLKAKWLKEHGDDVSSLHVIETVTEGEKVKQRVKLSRSRNPLTEGFTSLIRKLDGRGMMSENVQKNLDALVEIRDAAIHFYDESGRLEIKVHEVASASVQNFASMMKEWFARDLSEEYRFALMPLSFVNVAQSEATVVNSEVENLLDFLDGLERDSDRSDTERFVAIPIDLNLTRKPRSETTRQVRITNSPDAREVRLDEEQVLLRYPLSYREMVDKCRERYSDFKTTSKFHELKKKMAEDSRFAHTRLLDPKKPNSGKKTFYSHAILQEFDKHYTRN